jgi:hypothetical protein
MKQNHWIKTLGTSIFLLSLALTAAAAEQERPITTNKEMENTVKVTVTGETDLNYVWRRAEITAFTGGVAALPGGFGGSTPGNSSAENTFEGFVALRLSVDLSDKVSAVIEIGNKRVDGSLVNFFAGSNAAGSATAQTIKLREARVTISELFMPELRLEMGISTWVFDIRGQGSSMAYDPRHSQRFNRNLSTAAGAPVGNAADTAATLGIRAHDPEELEPMGLWLRYGRESLSFDIVALPAVIEGGAVAADEAFYAMDLIYKLDGRGSQIGLIVSLTPVPGAPQVVTFGGGVDYKAIENLEVYAEFYFNRGAISPTITSDGYAYQIGFVFTTGGELKPFIGLNWTYFSGDGDGGNNNASTFSGYENIHDLLILEDLYTGFDWDSNYKVIKISAGLALNAGGLNNLKLSLLAGIGWTAKPLQPSGVTKLGNEIDAKAEWDLTKQVAIDFGIGFLYGSRVLQVSMAGAPGARGDTIMFTFGTNLKF